MSGGKKAVPNSSVKYLTRLVCIWSSGALPVASYRVGTCSSYWHSPQDSSSFTFFCLNFNQSCWSLVRWKEPRNKVASIKQWATLWIPSATYQVPIECLPLRNQLPSRSPPSGDRDEQQQTRSGIQKRCGGNYLLWSLPLHSDSTVKCATLMSGLIMVT